MIPDDLFEGFPVRLNLFRLFNHSMDGKSLDHSNGFSIIYFINRVCHIVVAINYIAIDTKAGSNLIIDFLLTLRLGFVVLVDLIEDRDDFTSPLGRVWEAFIPKLIIYLMILKCPEVQINCGLPLSFILM
jgi:hypothetical protein